MFCLFICGSFAPLYAHFVCDWWIFRIWHVERHLFPETTYVRRVISQSAFPQISIFVMWDYQSEKSWKIPHFIHRNQICWHCKLNVDFALHSSTWLMIQFWSLALKFSTQSITIGVGGLAAGTVEATGALGVPQPEACYVLLPPVRQNCWHVLSGCAFLHPQCHTSSLMYEWRNLDGGAC